MESKKNEFEKRCQENDQILRETENRLKQEKNEKLRLEQTTDDLNAELQNTKRKLHSLENAKEELNQRCIQLEDERNNHSKRSIYLTEILSMVSTK